MSFRHLGHGRYASNSSLALRVGGEGAHLTIVVPAGYEFDVSVPRQLRWAFSPHDHRFLRAAAFHDYALHELNWPRELAAAPFGHALREDGVGRVRRLMMVLAVIAKKWS